MQYFLDVVLPIPLERLFTYKITSAEAAFLKPGMRVAVPFGKSKIYTALAYNVHQSVPQVYDAKEIYQILDESPIVNAYQLKHWVWIANYYMCTLGEVLRSALPSAFLLESETLILPNKEVEVDEMGLKDDEFLVFEALQHQSALKIAEVSGMKHIHENWAEGPTSAFSLTSEVGSKAPSCGASLARFTKRTTPTLS